LTSFSWAYLRTEVLEDAEEHNENDDPSEALTLLDRHLILLK
jgi:hypothetical protein